MKTHTLIAVFLAAALLTAAAQAEEQTPAASSGTTQAQADLKIFSDLRLPVTREDVLTFQKTMPSKVRITQMSEANPVAGSAVLTLRVETDASTDESPTAKEDVYAFIETLKNRLKDHHRSLMQRFESQHRIYMEAIEQAEGRLFDLQVRQNQIAGDMPMDKQSVLQRQMEKTQALTEMDLQRTVLSKRLDELSSQIAETQAALNARIDQDELLINLREMLAQQESEFENVLKQQQQHDAIIPGMNELREKLMASKMRLAERRRQLEMEAGGDRLQDLNHQLRETAMHLDEIETRRTVLRGTGTGSLEKSIEYEILEIKINAAKENLHNSLMEKNEYERHMKLIQPPTVVIGHVQSAPVPADSQQ